MLTPVLPIPAPEEGSGRLPLPRPGNGTHMLVVTPRSLQDARSVIEAVRGNHTVLVNSAWLEDSPGQRLIDVVCGGIAALRGQAHRIAEEVFLFAPGAVVVQRDHGGDGRPDH